MSASREKKKRQEFVAGGGVDPKAVRAAQEKAAEKRSKILYTTLGIVFVVATVFMLVYNSGILQRSRTALTIDGEKYTAADVSYFYTNAYQNFLGKYGQMIGFVGLDPNKSLKDQGAWGGDEQTWDEYFKDEAVNAMKLTHAAVKAAEADGVTLSDEELASVSETIETLKANASSNGYTYKSYLAAMYGSVMTPEVYEENLSTSFLASKYINAHGDELSFTDEEILAYYEENKKEYDLVDGGYVSISGIPETKKDEEGNTIETTDEDKAVAMDGAKAQAEALLADYKANGDLAAAAEAADLTFTGGEEITYSSGFANDWLFDETRKAGDAEVLVDESAKRVYVAVFNGRQRDETPSYDVRHILITKDNVEVAEGETATDEQILAKAEEILAGWDGTEDGFAKLAEEYSKDEGSNTKGGLYEDVNKGQMVTNFNDWCYAEGRKAGDTGIVKSDYGQHIMYFVGYGDGQYWSHAANIDMINNAMSEWQTELTESVTAEVMSGMSSVGK